METVPCKFCIYGGVIIDPCGIRFLSGTIFKRKTTIVRIDYNADGVGCRSLSFLEGKENVCLNNFFSEFRAATQLCEGCGSQRCDRSIDWIANCSRHNTGILGKEKEFKQAIDDFHNTEEGKKATEKLNELLKKS